MAIPIIGYVAATIGAGILQRIITPTLDATFSVEPTKRATIYGQNLEEPNVMIGPDVAIQLFHGGFLGETRSQEAYRKMQRLLSIHGIDVVFPGVAGGRFNEWGSYVMLQRQKPGLQDVVTLYHHGQLTRLEAVNRMVELGWSNPIERNLMLGINTPLPLELTVDMFHSGEINRERAEQQLKSLGYMSEFWIDKLLTRPYPWTPPDIRTMFLRGDISDVELGDFLKRVGIYKPVDQALFSRLLAFLPPPSDLIRFAVKDIFDPNLPDREGMLREYGEQTQLREWFRIQGIGPYTFTGSDGEPIEQDIGELYWLASFELPSPTQAYTMYQRLRPNRVTRYQVGEENGQPIYPQAVTITDVRALLKDKDYRPGWRDRLAAISFLPVQKIDVGRMYAEGVYGQPLGREGWGQLENGSYGPTNPAEVELFEVMMDRGYSKYDAGQLGYLESAKWEQSRGGKARPKLMKLLCQSYQLGAIDRGTLIERLRAAGVKELEAVAFADNCDLEYHVTALRKAIAAIRTGFLTGRIDANQTRMLLNQQNVALPKVDQLLRLWQVELIGRQKEATANQMCDWVGKGLLTQEDMALRLRRLGWREEDVLRIVRHCVLGHLARSASDAERVARREARERERVEKELQRLRERGLREAEQRERRAQQAAEKALNRLREGREPNKVKKYYRAGLITLPAIRAVLADRGWDAVDIDRWILVEL